MKIITTLAALSLYAGLTAQTVQFIEPRNVMNVSRPEDIFTWDNGGNHYVMYKQFSMNAPLRLDLQMDVYGPQQQPVSSRMYDQSLTPGDANTFEGLFKAGDKLVMLKSGYEKGANSIFAYPIAANGERGASQLLTEIASEKAMNSGFFQTHASDDGSKIVVLSEYPFEKNGKEKAKITVFDSKLARLWEKEIELPFESKRSTYNDIYVNNNGTAFLLKKVLGKKSMDTTTVFTFTGNGAKMNQQTIRLGENGNMSTWKPMFTEKGDLVLAGYYYENKNVGVNVEDVIGTFYMRVSGTEGAITVLKTANFPKRQGLKVKRLIPQADNSLLLVSEVQYENKTVVPGSNPTAPQYTYEYSSGDIFIDKLNSDGSMAWEYRINRDLKSANDGGRLFSTFVFISDSKINVLYNDFTHKHDGLKHTVVGPDLIYQRSAIVETIGMDGSKIGEKMLTDPRLGGKRGEYFLIPATGLQLSGNEIFVVGARGLELVGMKITF